MPNGGRQFKSGESGNPGGRPKKPEWLKGKGEDALKVCYEIMQNAEEKSTDRLAAAKIIIEHDLGKPMQQVDMTADLGDETKKALTERMTLDECKAIIEQFKA